MFESKFIRPKRPPISERELKLWEEGHIIADLEGLLSNLFSTTSGVEFMHVGGGHVEILPPCVITTHRLFDGFGMTKRNIRQMEKHIPGCEETIRTTNGTVVFLGNGLSCAPLELKEFSNIKSVVIVDLVNYSLLLQDLEQLKKIFKERSFSFPFEWAMVNAERLLTEKLNGGISIINYSFGTDNLPPELSEVADLAINCLGPSEYSLSEQIAVLKPSGTLLLARKISPKGCELFKD